MYQIFDLTSIAYRCMTLSLSLSEFHTMLKWGYNNGCFIGVFYDGLR